MLRRSNRIVLTSDSVVVASGLIALVDDTIKRRSHPEQTRRLQVPLARSSSFKLNMEYIGPKRLIDEVFNRTRASSSRPLATSHR